MLADGHSPHFLSYCHVLPCLIFEDEHLLVVNKPPGLNTHAPSPYAGEGLYDWLRHREPCWADLAIIHRLDKETSGVIVFGKTPLANRSLTQQFAERRIAKRYLLLTDRNPPRRSTIVRSNLKRIGDQYFSRPARPNQECAETRFVATRLTAQISTNPAAGTSPPIRKLPLIEALPLTGRTHQIRRHFAAVGHPIAGDKKHGDFAFNTDAKSKWGLD